MSGRLQYRRLRAPQADGETLVDPPIDRSAGPIAQNRQAAATRQLSLGGRSFQDLVHQGRAHLLSAAARYTQRYARADWMAPAATTGQRIYVLGHQPELFHPGVWLKNFVLDGLAKRDDAVAVHVLIDNDVAANVAIPTPSGSIDSPDLQNIELDRPASATPWEERRLVDAAFFRDAGRRITAAIAPFIKAPLAKQLWASLGETNSADAQLGALLARMRHRLELCWGLQTLDVPLSILCDSTTFRWFVAFLLSQADRLRERHNSTLAEYRRLHRLRSDSHPVPDLGGDEFVYELPFWVWNASDARRRKLFAQDTGDGLHLSDGKGWTQRLPRPSPDSFHACEAVLAALEGDGVKIRPRALTTTMYLRVFLGDYFLHGIGGAKYDQITDCLIEDLFGSAAPHYMTVSGTKRLPIDVPEPAAPSLREIERRLRDAEFNPDKLLPAGLSGDRAARAVALAEEKRALLRLADGQINDRRRHESLQRLNVALRDYVSDEKERLLQRRRELERQQRAREILTSREFSLCLFPEAGLRAWLLGAVAGRP